MRLWATCFLVLLPAVGFAADKAEVSGELKQWHKVTLTADGPAADEANKELNPFTDYRMTVVFEHESGEPRYEVPGYFAADGDAANTGATSGNKWRAHLSPDKPGRWTYSAEIVEGDMVAVAEDAGDKAVFKADGEFLIAPTDKTGEDFRSKGRLEYVGGHYLRFAGSGKYFLKAGPDSPETLLAYRDFDNTVTRKEAKGPLKSWQPHVMDWREGDPTWHGGRGKGLIGALNYLAEKGCNTVSFLPYNAGGDGDNVWPFVDRDDPLRYDCSKLDQWQVVFDHATNRGLHLHFKLQENEMDDLRLGEKREQRDVPEALDGGALGPERKLYCRELIARFSHELALNWNIGEENTQSPEEQRAMIAYLSEIDPYKHNIVIHTFPGDQDRVYTPLLGDGSKLTGASLQNSWNAAHQRTLKWVHESAEAGKPWVVCNDEQGPASDGVPPDPGYKDHDGIANKGKVPYDLHDIRKLCLWGTLTAGGAGVEYYFGYSLPQHDLVLEDFRSRDRSWDYCRYALEFFEMNDVPFWEMTNADVLVGNAKHANGNFCFAKPGSVYVVYLPEGGTAELDLGRAQGNFRVEWYNPREGGTLLKGSSETLKGGSKVSIGNPPKEPDQDWVALVRQTGK